MSEELPVDVPDEVRAAATTNHSDEVQSMAEALARAPKQQVIDETDDLLKEKLAAFREEIESDLKMESIGQATLVERERSDAHLLRFLRARKFDVTRSVKLLAAYEKYVDEKGFSNLSASHPHVQAIAKLRMMIRTVNPTTYDKDGHLVVCISCAQLDYDAFTIEEFETAFWYMMEKVLENEAAQRLGVTMVIDMTGYSFFGNFTKAVELEKQLGKVLQDCMPLRVGHGFIMNSGVMFYALWQVVKFFVKPKIRERVHILGSDVEEMFEFCGGKAAIPDAVGGERKTTDADCFILSDDAEGDGEGQGQGPKNGDGLDWI